MRRMSARVAVGIALGMIAGLEMTAATPVEAADVQARAAKFLIAKMTCATCPITVKTAISRVAGVKSVDVNFEAKTATVVFDPKKTNLKQIAAASTNAGFPATLKN